MLGFASCKDDPIDPVDPNNPNDNVDPVDTTETETCFEVIDLTNSIDYARSIHFINTSEGWLLANGVDGNNNKSLLYTSDGGLTWSEKNTDLKVQTWTSTSQPYFTFFNSSDGYMIEEAAWISGMGSANKIKYTTDQGQTWTEIVDASFGTWDVLAVNSTDAVFIGHDIYGHESGLSILYRVSNTTHQVTQTVELPVHLEFNPEVDMNLSEDGVINVPIKMLSGDSDIYMARSADFGVSWTYTPINTTYIYDVNFPSNNTGYVLANEKDQIWNTIFKTTDGGMTWTEKLLSTNDPSPDFNYINFYDDQNGLGVETSGIFETIDGGETWTEISCFNSSGHSPTRGIAYVSLNKWYAPGTRYDADEDKTYTEFYIYKEE